MGMMSSSSGSSSVDTATAATVTKALEAEQMEVEKDDTDEGCDFAMLQEETDVRAISSAPTPLLAARRLHHGSSTTSAGGTVLGAQPSISKAVDDGAVCDHNARSAMSKLRSLVAQVDQALRYFVRARETNKSVLPFLCFVLITGTVLAFYDTCNISPGKRKDCGYPGISTQQCVLYGRWQSKSSAKRAASASGVKLQIRTFVGWASLGSSLWAISGYDVGGLLFYLLLAGVTTFQQTGCCYDGQVQPGVPHCYC
ncbi:unnamed protein product [Amoebophrya sp. A120]|nr:unnamed protein product [Amoebophrya sp. A120]|eukprot:GSA120T00002361001.1